MRLVTLFTILMPVWIQTAQSDPDGNSTVCPKGCMTISSNFTCIDSGCIQFPVSLIDDPHYVEYIDLSFNAIASLPALNYTRLNFLDLSHNAITSVLDDAFKGCPKLAYLNLSYNAITNISKLQMPELTHLDVSNNALTILRGDSFVECLKLKEFNLSFNVIQIVNRDFFKAGVFSNLETLDLSNNRINSIEAYAFQFTTKLIQLDLSQNRLLDFNDNSLYHDKLRVLHLEGNLLSIVKVSHFQDLDSVQYLSLRNNQIESMEKDSFQNLKHLQRLDMGENLLEDIKENIFHEGLKHPFSELEAVHFDNNKVKTIHAHTFSPFPKLEYIFLDRNNIVDISPNGSFPPSLKEISLTENKGLKSIQNGTFSGLKKLTIVNLSGCYKLETIASGSFDGVQSTVTVFDASQCGLKHLEQSLFNYTKMTGLELTGNPWECDCNLVWAKTGLPLDILQTMQCATPHRVKGQTVDEVETAEMLCTFYSRHRHGLGIGLIVVATIIFIITAGLLIYSYRKRVYLPSSQSRGTYQTLFNAADDASDPSVSIQVENSGPETSLLYSTAPAPVSV